MTYALNTFALAVATLASLISWTALEHRGSIKTVLRDITILRSSSKRDTRPRQGASGTGDVPAWWYLICLALGLTLAIFAIEYWAIELRWYGVLLGFAVGGVFFFPVSQSFEYLPNYVERLPANQPDNVAVRKCKHESRHRSLLPHHRGIRLGRSSCRQHLVRRTRIHNYPRWSFLCAGYEALFILPCVSSPTT
jgi:hypothetical protein